MDGGQALVAHQFPRVVGDAVFIQIFVGLRLAARLVGEYQRHTVVDHRLAAHHIPESPGGHRNVGEHLGVRLPADDGAGTAALVGLLLQAAHVFAFFEVQVIVEAVPVDVGGHPLAGVLGGAQAQAVQAQAEIVVAAAFGVFAAGVQLTEHQVPVPALFRLVVVHRDAAAEVLDFDHFAGEQRHVDAVAVPVAGFVDGIGNDLKNGMGAAFHAVRTENDGRAFADAVGALQLADAVVAVFLLLFCHALVPPAVTSCASVFAHTNLLNHK